MKTKLVSCCIIFLCAGIFIGIILDRVYYHKVLTHEFTIKTVPEGLQRYPYKPHHWYWTTLPAELHKVKIRNGKVVKVTRTGFAYQEKINEK